MEEKNVGNNQDQAEKEEIKPKRTINLTVQEFVILGLCLILTAVIIICNCIYSIPVATVQTTYATSSISTKVYATGAAATSTDENYSAEGGDTTLTSSTSTQTSSLASSAVSQSTKSTDAQQSSVVKSSASSSATASTGLVNINTADITALCTLNGIGPAKAQAIITYRETNGSFTSIDQLNEVHGIGDIIFNKIKDYVTIN